MADKDEPIRLYGILSGLLRKGNAEVYITGSNSKFLSSDIRTEFRDRGDDIYIAPLSFSEYYHASSLDKYDAWREYIFFGGLPHVLEEKGDINKMNYLKSLNKKIYLADLVEGKHERKQFEVDFVVNCPNTKVYIQSALAITDERKINLELASLNIIPDSFKKIVITGGNFKPGQNEQGIQFIPLFDFLLNKSIL